MFAVVLISLWPSHLDYKSKLTSANVMDNVLTLPETEAVGWQT